MTEEMTPFMQKITDEVLTRLETLVTEYPSKEVSVEEMAAALIILSAKMAIKMPGGSECKNAQWALVNFIQALQDGSTELKISTNIIPTAVDLSTKH